MQTEMENAVVTVNTGTTNGIKGIKMMSQKGIYNVTKGTKLYFYSLQKKFIEICKNATLRF